MWELSINGVDFYHIANWFYIYSFLAMAVGNLLCIGEKRQADKQRLYQWPFMYHIWLRSTCCLSDSSSCKRESASFVCGRSCSCNGFGICDSSSDGEYFPYVMVGLQ